MTASQGGKESSGRRLHSSFRSLLPSGVPRCFTRYSTKMQTSFSSGLLGGFSHRSPRPFTVPGSTLPLSSIICHFHCPLLTLLQPSWLSLSFFNYQVLPCQGEFAPAVSACQVPRIPSPKPHFVCLTSSQSCFCSQMKDHFLGKSLSPAQIGFSSFMLLECCSCITFLSQHLYHCFHGLMSGI